MHRLKDTRPENVSLSLVLMSLRVGQIWPDLGGSVVVFVLLLMPSMKDTPCELVLFIGVDVSQSWTDLVLVMFWADMDRLR